MTITVRPREKNGKMNKNILVLSIVCLLVASSILTITVSGTSGIVRKRHYWTLTSDLRKVNLYRYDNIWGKKDVPVILVPGWTENHLIFDSSDSISDRSIAKYLAEDMRDVWIVELRTHDTDGDPGTAQENEEHMNKFWDFDKTYVKKDLVAAINFIKWKTGEESFVIGGHSMGGSIAVAYAEILGQENFAGLLTIGTPVKPMPVPDAFKLLRALYCDEEGQVRLLAPVNFDPNNDLLIKLMLADMATYNEGGATEWWLNWQYIGTLNDEPAGVCVDLWWGMDQDLHENWLDPEGYDYTSHLPDITVPVLCIGGLQDEMALPEQVEALCDEGGVSSVDKTLNMFEGFGHVDLLIGKNAPTEIFPVIRDWLNNRFS